MTERCLFLLIILMEAGIFFYLINDRRMVGGQDGFQYFALQYTFLNNVVHYHEIPQWLPFMTHGTVATWWYAIQAGIFQNVLFLSGNLFKDINFLPLFYLGIFVDELLLLIGVWLLGRRFFASPLTVFFVTLSIMGSCIWILQPWWNFHLYYAIPLILYFIHTFLDSGKWRYYFLAGNLLFIQCLGNLPYFLPVTSLVIFLYFLFYFIFNRDDSLQKVKSLRFGWSFVMATALIILSFIALYHAMNFGTDQIANYNPARNPDGTTTLDGFLSYGGNLTWSAWLELFLGVSPFLNYTLYIGTFCVPCILLGLLLNSNKHNIHFYLTGMVLFLFSMGTVVSVFFYYGWPMMKYFRHLALVSPIIKVFLCFLAGFGFDAVFFSASRAMNPRTIKAFLALSSLIMFGMFFVLLFLANHHEATMNVLINMVPAKHTFFRTLLNETLLVALLKRTALFAIFSSIFLVILLMMKREKYFYPLIVFLLAIHGADIYGFKLSEISLKTARLNDELYNMTEFRPMPYTAKRNISFQNNNPRVDLLKILPIQYAAFFNWSTHSFLFQDELGNIFRTDHWLLPLDHFMKAYWGQSIHDSSEKPFGLVDNVKLEFPREHPAALKIAGVTEDKIQFFSKADIIYSDDTIASLITNNSYNGDIIFLSKPEMTAPHSADLSEEYLSSRKRLPMPYRVERFNANHLEVTTDIGGLESAWLLYSDVWHPFWRATVNGKEIPVEKANLAYKAVKLEKGLNRIHFYFKSQFIDTLYFIFSVNALCWFVVIIYMSGKMIFNPQKKRINCKKV